MRAFYTIVFLLLLTGFGHAQSVKLEWAKHNGGNGHSGVTDMAVADSGFVYVVGYFTDTVDFDPGPDTLNLVSAGDKDIFIQKLAPDGSLVWVKRIGGLAADEVNAIALDAQGNAYLTGSFVGTTDFNPGPAVNNQVSTSGSKDIFVAKLTAAGNYAYAYKMGGAGTDVGQDLVVDAAGAVYITGSFVGTVNFNPGGTAVNLTSASPNFPDFFIQKINAVPAYVWTKRIGGTGFDEALGIALDNAGNVYTTGYFSVFVDFDPNAGTDTLYASPSRDVFILKLTNAGNYVWTKQLDGSIFSSQGNDIQVDAAHNIYLTGHFVSTVDFDPGPDTVFLTPAGGSDPFVLKLDSTGGYLWARQLPGVTSNQGLAVAVDAEGSVYTTGYFSATVDFDPGPDNVYLTTNGLATDMYVQKLDSMGQLIWARNIGNNGADRGDAISVDTLGNVYIAGSFAGTVDFDPTAGVYDITSDSTGSFVTKWTPCEPTYAVLDTAACYSFTSSIGEVYTATGTYTEYLLNATGCDSILVINLTINDTARETISHTACGSYELNGQTYDSTGVYTQTLTSAVGCDSVLTLNLTINAAVVAAATQNGDTLTATTTGTTYQWLDCNNGYEAIPDADDMVFVPTVSGDYALAVSANGCTDTSTCFNVTIIGIGESLKQRFRLYPNPNTGRFTIALGEFYPEVNVTVHSMAGSTLWEGRYLNQSAIEMDLDMPAGVYLVTLTTPQGQRQVLRLVKE